jgi:hypothetical protein
MMMATQSMGSNLIGIEVHGKSIRVALFAGFLYWCEQNHFCAKGLAKHCTRFIVQIAPNLPQQTQQKR